MSLHFAFCILHFALAFAPIIYDDYGMVREILPRIYLQVLFSALAAASQAAAGAMSGYCTVYCICYCTYVGFVMYVLSRGSRV